MKNKRTADYKIYIILYMRTCHIEIPDPKQKMYKRWKQI